MGWAAVEHKILFYADGGPIAGKNTIWVQTNLIEVISIFQRLGLLTNIVKTKTMVCTPGFIWGQQGTAVYNRVVTGGVGANFGSGI